MLSIEELFERYEQEENPKYRELYREELKKAVERCKEELDDAVSECNSVKEELARIKKQFDLETQLRCWMGIR